MKSPWTSAANAGAASVSLSLTDEAEQPEPRERGGAEQGERGPRQKRTGHAKRIGPAH